MSVIRKSVRFHDNNPSDLEIMHALCNYKNYGFRSESHMIIEALRLFLSGNETQFDPSMELLADMIAKRIASMLNIAAVPGTVPSGETTQKASDHDETGDEDEAYNVALSFLDTL